MKRIAILAPYVGTVNRGAETFVIELTRKLSDRFDIDVYTIREEPTIASQCVCISVKEGLVLKLHSLLFNRNGLYRNVVNRFYYLIPEVLFQKIFTKAAASVLSDKNYDLLFPNNGVWGARYSRELRGKNNIPYIYTGHGGIGQGEKKVLEEKPDAYICLTGKQYNWAESVKEQETKTVLIPNGVNVQEYNQRKREESQNRKVISVGALTAFKRHQLTIEAVSKMENVELIILGKGEEEKKLEKLAQEKLPGRCIITSCSYQEIKRWYASADLFVLPSKEEPFGIVYLEAMAAGLAVVAPDDEPRREIIGEAGLFCNVENTEDYAESIQKALDIEWGNLPIQRALKFDWENVAEQYAALIDEICEGAG